eukprot:TRINITY_DN955_c0_g1_i1.p2 TRINITY_DN955_c0_g1~~TRINITY_DN955_c0_g1_i1.p2  ORF type:complete len:143 (-),score=27.77 TRINITY_DN955_c0_g1_i1:39-434(-)
MLMPKQTRKQILTKLFEDGVLVAKKQYRGRHPVLAVPNLYVIKLMTSLKSRGYITESYNWNHFYWYLTNEGIEYLREYLNLPFNIVPNTFKAQKKVGGQAPAGGQRRPKDAAPGEFNPQFASDAVEPAKTE